MTAVRVTAAYVENTREKLVFVGSIKKYSIVSGELLGYLKDEDGPNDALGTYPFIIRPGRGKADNKGEIFWGEWPWHCKDFPDVETTNVFGVKIKVGEYFSRHADDEECVYRITHVVPL